MKTLKVRLQEQSYPICIGATWDSTWTQTLLDLVPDKTLFIVTQARIKKQHGSKLAHALKSFKQHWIVVPDGERHKNLNTVAQLVKNLARLGAGRSSTLVAFGGGVVGDITGFAAAIYQRGVSFVQIPTTMLAQVDSSVGGKTGVDTAFGKNIIGAFHQPRAVFAATAFLKSLPDREFRCGMAEIIKAALISSASFCNFLKTNAAKLKARDSKILAQTIERALRVKIDLVERDPFENGDRAKLNYGHSLGHAIETLTHYKTFKHGEAVAMGLAFATHLADRLELAATSTRKDVLTLLDAFHLPTAWPRFTRAQYAQALRRDKKTKGSTIRFILPEKLGKVRIKPLQIEDIVRWL